MNLHSKSLNLIKLGPKIKFGHFFVTDDKPVLKKSGDSTCLEKGAKCHVPLEGAGNKFICNLRFKQGGSTTSG
jgi:hypothetical protein